MKSNDKTIMVDGLEIDLIHRDIRSAILRLNPKTGRPELRIGPHVTEQAAIAFARTHMDDLHRWLSARQPAMDAQDYHDGATIHLWGHPVTVVSRPGGRTGATFQGNTLVFTGSPADRTQAAAAAYRREMDRAVRQRLPLLIQIAGLPCSGFAIRDTTSRWGSFTIPTHRMSLSLRLAHKPSCCLDSVILHELCHNLSRYHDRIFYAKLDLLHSAIGLSRAECDALLKDKRTDV